MTDLPVSGDEKITVLGLIRCDLLQPGLYCGFRPLGQRTR